MAGGIQKPADALPHAIDIVTFIPKLPLSANNCAIDVSNTRQSEFKIAEDTPSCIERGMASHVNLRLCPFNSNLLSRNKWNHDIFHH